MTRSPAIVIIPVYKRTPTALEAFSLSRCVAVLGHHPLTFIGPQTLDFGAYRAAAPAATVTTFDEHFFRSLAGYSEMLLTPAFYETFGSFDRVLIHQLDAFVFEDQLAHWCAKPYDYIGAPWLSADGHFSGVGNGGFSLRDVSACVAVLKARAQISPNQLWTHVRQTTPSGLIRALKYHRKLLAHLGLGNDLNFFLRKFVRRGHPEDMFWGLHAPRFCPSFRVAPEETAIHFSVEKGLEVAWPRLAGNPPFGCHRNAFLDVLQRHESGQPPKDGFERQVCALADAANIGRRYSPHESN